MLDARERIEVHYQSAPHYNHELIINGVVHVEFARSCEKRKQINNNSNNKEGWRCELLVTTTIRNEKQIKCNKSNSSRLERRSHKRRGARIHQRSNNLLLLVEHLS